MYHLPTLQTKIKNGKWLPAQPSSVIYLCVHLRQWRASRCPWRTPRFGMMHEVNSGFECALIFLFFNTIFLIGCKPLLQMADGCTNPSARTPSPRTPLAIYVKRLDLKRICISVSTFSGLQARVSTSIFWIISAVSGR